MAGDLNIISEISSLTCCVCYEKISQTKTLYCGHSICSVPCLDNIIQGSRPSCPVCQVVIKLPPSGDIADLPTNHGLGSVLRSYRNSRTPDEGTPCSSGGPVDTVHPGNHEWSEKCGGKLDPTKGLKSPGRGGGCRLHHRAVRFLCETCSEDICYRCIQTIHSSHEFAVKNLSDHDGAYVKDVITRTLGQRQRQKEISMKLLEIREGYMERSGETRSEIKMAATRAHDVVTAEETSLLRELDQLTTSRSNYFMDLLLALEHTMVRENKFSEMMADLGNSLEQDEATMGIEMIDQIEKSLGDIDQNIGTMEQLSDHDHPYLQFTPRSLNDDRLVGTMQKVGRAARAGKIPRTVPYRVASTVLKLIKRNEIKISRDCVGAVWLDSERCVMVIDKTSSKGFIGFKLFSIDGKGGIRYRSEELQKVGHGNIRVCGRASRDESSILLAFDMEVIRVTVKGDTSLTHKTIHVGKRPEAVSWGQSAGKYIVLTANPWQILQVDGSGSSHPMYTLPSLVYGPYLASLNSNFVVVDISKCVVVVNDATKIFPERSISSSVRLMNAYPAGVTLNPITEEWFFLWKSTSSKTDEDVDWMLTRYTSSFDYRGVILSGSMAERNPKHFTVYRNRLAILFHGGNTHIYDLTSYQITE